MTEIFDKFDKRILSEIEFDYNKSHSIIAKKIKRSKSFVSYRIKRMEEENIISYKPLIDYSKLGYSYYRIIIETTLNKKEILEIIGKKLKLVWLIEKLDKDNFVFVVLAKSNSEFQNIWENIYDKISNFVINKNISLAFKIHHFPMTFLHNYENNHFITGFSEKVEVTNLQNKIIEQLNLNPKITYFELCKKLSVHQLTLKKNIKYLEDQKVILAYQTTINKAKLNIQHYKIWFDYGFSLNKKKIIVEILKFHKSIIYITESSHGYDIEFEVFVFNNDELRNLIDKLKKEIDIRRVAIIQIKSEEKLI